MSEALLVFVTIASPEQGEKLAAELVDRRLAAGVNLLPGVQSIYRWKGEIRRASETLLLIKTSRCRFEELSRTIRELHSYEVPQIIAAEIDVGSEDYLRWVVESTAAR